MPEAGATSGSDPKIKAVADMVVQAVETTREGIADAREAAARALPEANSLISKLAYNTCYAVSYGVVFPTVLLARSVPRNNALVHGLVDGAHAAMDLVDEMKRAKAVESHPTPGAAAAGLPDPGVAPTGSGGE
jgi:hypothetical protein